MSDAARYDIVQTAFLIGMAASAASDILATQAQLKAYLGAALNGGTDPLGLPFRGFLSLSNPQLAGGDWSVDWGPCICSRAPNLASHATNAMYVAHSPSLRTYVVAIAGPRPGSLYEWLAEDGEVAETFMAQWPVNMPFVQAAHSPWVGAPPPALSAATANGMSNLLAHMADPWKGTLQTYLSTIANTSATIIFTGHGLAGALAPALAFYFYPQPGSYGWKQVAVLPLAGASPGNASFAAQFTSASKYPPVASGVDAPYGNWNIDYVNAHDLVPHAWNQLDAVISGKNGAGNYESIYGVMDPAIGDGVTATIEAAKLLALGGDYQNVTQVQFSPSWGNWTWVQNEDGSWQYPPVWTALPRYTDANPISSVDELGSLIEAAHIDQYYNFFGVTPAQRMPSSTPASIARAKLDRALLIAAKVSV